MIQNSRQLPQNQDQKKESFVEPIGIRRTQSEIPASAPESVSVVPYSARCSGRKVPPLPSPTSSILTNTQNSFTPITSHYNLNAKLYKAFFKICDRRRYKLALSVGLQYCRVSLFDIPTHGYYNSPKYFDLKIESAKNAVHVSNVMCNMIIEKILKEEEKKMIRSGKNANSEYIYGEKISLPSDLLEKFEEAKLLREVAKENIKVVQTRSSSRGPGRGDSFLKKEVVKVEEEEDIPGWLKILDCGSSESMINLCSSSLRRKGKVAHSVKQQERRVEQTPRRRQQEEEDVLLNDFFGRTASSPANLGTPPPSQMKGEDLCHVQQHQGHELRASSISMATENSNSSLAADADERDDSPVSEKPKHDEQYESDLERALYLSGLEFQSSANQDDFGKYSAQKNLKKVETEEVGIDTVSLIYREDFEEMLKSGQVCLSFIETYQGRIPGSLNGCTVIAPLLAIHHLCDEQVLSERSDILMKGGQTGSELTTQQKRSEQYANPAEDEHSEHSSSALEALDKDTIRAVIDVQAPLVLPKVRVGLGLHDDALIIPSDVHDFLMNLNMLHQNQFVDVCTGNILDDLDLAKFIEAMAGVDTSKDDKMVEEKKLAATFYFHEHVISILRKTRRTYTSVRDIESKNIKAKKPPRRALFKRRNGKQKKQQERVGRDIPHYNTIVDEETYFEIIDSLPGSTMLGKEYAKFYGQTDDDDSAWIPATARIRCCSMKSLHAALRWYACSKFTSEDKKFIDTYQWDHVNVDFDPRVFQGFIWSE